MVKGTTEIALQCEYLGRWSEGCYCHQQILTNWAMEQDKRVKIKWIGNWVGLFVWLVGWFCFDCFVLFVCLFVFVCGFINCVGLRWFKI